MTINFTDKDRENIAMLFEYENLSEDEQAKVYKNFENLLINNESHKFLYVIRCLPHDYYKIGITNDIDKRIETHQTGCPLELKLVFAVEADIEDYFGREIVYLEQFFHKNYTDNRVRGEWFELTNKEITEICIFLQNDRDFDILHNEAEELKEYLDFAEVEFRKDEGV